MHDGMKPGFGVLFCLESQKSTECEAFHLSLNEGINRDTVYYQDVCFYEICRSSVSLKLANKFKIK